MYFEILIYLKRMTLIMSKILTQTEKSGKTMEKSYGPCIHLLPRLLSSAISTSGGPHTFHLTLLQNILKDQSRFYCTLLNTQPCIIYFIIIRKLLFIPIFKSSCRTAFNIKYFETPKHSKYIVYFLFARS